MNHTTSSRWPRPHADPAAAALAELADQLAATAPGDWSDQAACRRDGTDRHWPTGAESSPGYRQHAADAMRVCAWCPVRAECLAHALENGEDDGIWGGTTPRQRRQIRKSRTAPAASRSHIAS